MSLPMGRNGHEKWKFIHLSTLFVYRVSGAYCGFMVLVLLSKIEGIETFKATNLHQNAVKTYFNRGEQIMPNTLQLAKRILRPSYGPDQLLLLHCL